MEATRSFRAPGRVNLMGDHTDYNEGFVLPIAVRLECRIDATPRGDGRIRVHSENEGTTVELTGGEDPATVTPEWGRYVAGTAWALAGRGRAPVGIDARVRSGVPSGSGLSSSAALCVAVALALGDAAGQQLGITELALACQEAEQRATGVPAGVMDQLASLAGRACHALLIDCRDLTWTHVPMPEGLGLVVVHSGIPRRLASSEYAARREACEAIAARLGLRALRDATPDRVRDEPLARHVVTENARVHQAADALRLGDAERLGELLSASHASLRDDYRVSTPELDLLRDELVAAGAYGARLTGAGFGGCVVAACAERREEDVGDRAAAAYARKSGLEPRVFPCRAAEGAGPA